jgi:hypothetical protein
MVDEQDRGYIIESTRASKHRVGTVRKIQYYALTIEKQEIAHTQNFWIRASFLFFFYDFTYFLISAEQTILFPGFS